MLAKKTLQALLVSAVAVTAAGGAAAASGTTGVAEPIRMAANGCQGHSKNSCKSAKDAGAKEKCYGVVRAGANDCANLAKTHSCAGHAKLDGDAGDWIALPKGVCDRLVGGEVKS